MYEVNNYEGIHSYIDGKLIRLSNFKRDDCFLQQDKCERRLQRLLNYWGIPFPVEKKVVFINPVFSLYQAPFEKGVLFLSGLKSHIQELDGKWVKLDTRHMDLAKKLTDRHKESFPYHPLPTYNYE